MAILCSRLILCYNSLAAILETLALVTFTRFGNSLVGGVVRSFPFQTKRVPNVVLVLLVEFVVSYSTSEGFSPEHDGFLNTKSNDLKIGQSV